jgi:hypothetical protein
MAGSLDDHDDDAVRAPAARGGAEWMKALENLTRAEHGNGTRAAPQTAACRLPQVSK